MASFRITNISKFTLNIPYTDIGGNRRNVRIDSGMTTVVRMSNEPPKLQQYQNEGMLRYTVEAKGGGAVKSQTKVAAPKVGSMHPQHFTQDPNKTLGILIVNWNNAKLTDDVLRDLTYQVDKGFEVTVIDQNSKERGTKDYMKIWSEIQEYPISVVGNEDNVDLNRVWDDFCKNSDYDFICFLNNDVRLGHFFTHDIRVALSRKDVGCVIHPTNKIQKNKELNTPSIEVLKTPKYQGWDFSIKRECYNKIPDQLRIFGGDNYLFAQVIEKGFNIALANSSPIIHLKEKTRVKNPDIKSIHKNDTQYWAKLTKEGGLRNIPSTIPDISEKYPPQGMSLTMNDKVVYTAIIGPYDALPSVRCGRVLGWDFICFTDTDIPPEQANGWRVVKLPKVEGGVVEKSKVARYYKLNYFSHLSRYRVCLWIDCRVDILQHPNKYLTLLNSQDIIFAKNLSKNFNTEVARVIEAKVETPKMVEAIKERYSEIGFDPNKYHSIASGVMIFKNNPTVKDFFTDWWSEVEQYSHRDQLSVAYAMHKNKAMKYGMLDYSKVYSEYFKLRPRRKKRATVR